ncbi:MAG TPA: IclR family transcriptional regulator [Sphingomonas sp.]|nr:IclR family transcriptional regulator [Sphingomonas sp.]
MRQKSSNGNSEGSEKRAGPQGSQTLLRGLDMLDQVVDGPVPLAELSARMGLTRSTTHRLANALIDRGFLVFFPREGYQLGPKLLQLGFLAQSQVDLIQTARPHIEDLATRTEDTVHLGRLDDERALYLDKIPGRRRVEISSRVGDRQPLTSTGLGKALMIDIAPQDWRRLFDTDRATDGGAPIDYALWEERMKGYVAAGRAYDLEENEDQIRCVAAPIRDASDRIVGAISVSSAAQYMDDARMEALTDDVLSTARAISADLGWNDQPPRKG